MQLNPRAWLPWSVVAAVALGCGTREDGKGSTRMERVANVEASANDHSGAEKAYHVYVGQEIQAALDLAAEDSRRKIVRVHSGVYQPRGRAHALIHFNRRHDGIKLEAIGEVTLTAANPQIARKHDLGYPAVVNHVVYFGDGISSQTSMKGFTITGANGFMSQVDPKTIEPHVDYASLKDDLFFHADGGAIKIFGQSYPTIENVTASANSTNLCGGAVSIQHDGANEDRVTFRNCVFQDNHCPGTGAAVDLLPGSSAVIQNCLFVGNISNTGMERLKKQLGLKHNETHGCGALTVFANSKVRVDRCTFTKNWNGVDDRGENNQYQNCIFWMNNASDGSRPGEPYEVDVQDGSGIKDCFLRGEIDDLRQTVDPSKNRLRAPDPRFDEFFRPTNPVYNDVGYRPPE